MSDDRTPPWPQPPQQPPQTTKTPAATPGDPPTLKATIDPLAKFYADQQQRDRDAAAAAAADAAAEREREAAQQKAKDAHNARLAKLELERRELELKAFRDAENAKDAERSRVARAAFAAEVDAGRLQAEAQLAHDHLARVETREVLASDAKRGRFLYTAQRAGLGLAVGGALWIVWRASRGAS